MRYFNCEFREYTNPAPPFSGLKRIDLERQGHEPFAYSRSFCFSERLQRRSSSNKLSFNSRVKHRNSSAQCHVKPSGKFDDRYGFWIKENFAGCA